MVAARNGLYGGERGGRGGEQVGTADTHPLGFLSDPRSLKQCVPGSSRCGIVLEVIISGEVGESLGMEFLEFCDLTLLGALLLNSRGRLRLPAERGCLKDPWVGRGQLGHTFNTSPINNFCIT